MGMVYKINVLQALKDKGYSTYRIKNDKLLSQSTLQKLREGKPVSWEMSNILFLTEKGIKRSQQQGKTLCLVLNC